MLVALFTSGYSFQEISNATKIPTSTLRTRISSEHDAKTSQGHLVHHLEARMDGVFAALSDCVDKEDATRVSALKEQMAYLRWKAAALTTKYAGAKESGSGGGGLTINIVGMHNARLIPPGTVHE
jgi:hypothetical protein